MKAVIFADDTVETHKCFDKPDILTEVLGKSLVEYNYELIKDYADGIIIVSSMEKRKCINKNDNITYCTKEEFYRNINELLDGTTLFLSGGSFYTHDISQFKSFHESNKKKISIAVSESPETSLIPVTFENTNLISTSEKSKWKFNNLFILEKEILGIDISKYLNKTDGNDVAVYASKEKFVAVNSVWDLMNVSLYLINKNVHSIHKSTFIDESACISKQAYIGKNCKIGKFAEIGAYVVIEDNCIIKDGAKIRYSTMCRDSYVGRNSEIEFSYVMENSSIGDRCILRGGNVVGKNFVVCNDSVIEENVTLQEKTFTKEKNTKNGEKILR